MRVFICVLDKNVLQAGNMGVTMHKVLAAMALWSFIINTRWVAAERDALVAFNASINDPPGRLAGFVAKGEKYSWGVLDRCDFILVIIIITQT